MAGAEAWAAETAGVAHAAARQLTRKEVIAAVPDRPPPRSPLGSATSPSAGGPRKKKKEGDDRAERRAAKEEKKLETALVRGAARSEQ
eukprot:1758305-Prymnesium_polylepis.1